MAKFTAKEILKQFDECANDFTFPMLDNGYVYLANTKLSAYRDDNLWVVIIEVIGFNYGVVVIMVLIIVCIFSVIV
jgi:hypothetical protein